MIMYTYRCENCDYSFERMATIEDRDRPALEICPSCKDFGVYKVPGCAGFKVPEGGCGNAANGYSSYHGDSENFKAGRKIYK